MALPGERDRNDMKETDMDIESVHTTKLKKHKYRKMLIKACHKANEHTLRSKQMEKQNVIAFKMNNMAKSFM